METDEYRKMFELEEDFWWYRGMARITEAILGRHFASKGTATILDAGCGTGKMLEVLRRFSVNGPVGFDFSKQAVRYSKRRGEPGIVQASVIHIPFPASSFDLVTSLDVLCQLPEGGDLQALREFHRVLGAGGKLFVRLPAYQWLYAGHDRHSLTLQRYTRSQLVSRLDAAGFAIIQVSYANFFLFPLLAAKRLLLEKIGILADSSDLRPVPSLLNGILEWPLRIESRLLRYPHFRFPWGLSIVGLAEKRL
ncbi:MAG: class I SAM-dependent methyltransferase [Acidobacteria bacterium]|nr:class I SAM-dependent methyltransferase [Acidobacteriota bacterium]